MTGKGKELLKQGQNQKRQSPVLPLPAPPPSRHTSWRCEPKATSGAALTHDGVLGLKQGPPLAQAHGAAHLPRIVLWHVYDLRMKTSTLSTLCSVRQTALSDMRLASTGWGVNLPS